jgi:hypothetical protein
MRSLRALTNAFSKSSHHYNAALPISIEVLESVGYRRYRLKVGHKEMTTRSMKPLAKGERYWGNFSEAKDGIITISNLKKKPTLMQTDSAFTPVDSFEFLAPFFEAKEPSMVLKNWLLEALANCDEKTKFQTLSSMLLALHEGIVHLPLSIDSRLLLLQWRENQNLNQPLVEFYLAYDNLGAVKGQIGLQENYLLIESLFERTAVFLTQQISNAPFQCDIKTNENLAPLWEGVLGLLDVKG